MQQQKYFFRHCATFASVASAAVISLACYTQARAAEPAEASPPMAGPAISLSGFGSVGIVHSSERKADYSTAVLTEHGVGYSGEWRADLDSRLGVQLDVTFNKRWSAVLQVISEQRVDGGYVPLVEWANLKYQVSPELALRIGRIALPMFIAADYRKVGYAYTWARTPVEVYRTVPITNNDGIDLTYRWQTGRVKHTTQAFFGRTVVKLERGEAVHGRHVAGIASTAELGALSARVSLIRGELSSNLLGDLFGGLRQFGPAGERLAAAYALDHTRAKAYTAGLSYDPGTWFVMSEFGSMQTASFLGANRAAYVSAGYRYSNFTPFITYARVKPDSVTRDPGLDLRALPPSLLAPAAMLNGYLNAVLGNVPAQRTLSAGARWDLMPSISLKLQYDRVQPDAGNFGTFIRVQPGFDGGHPVHIGSAVLDFVF